MILNKAQWFLNFNRILDCLNSIELLNSLLLHGIPPNHSMLLNRIPSNEFKVIAWNSHWIQSDWMEFC